MINDISTLRKLIPTVTGSNFDKYRQPIEDACAWFTSKIAGQALMAEIERQQPEPPSGLFVRARLVVAYKAYLLGIPKMDVRETDNGFAVVNDETLAPASRDRVSALVASMTESLHFALEQFIEYMEDTPSLHELWRLSPACSIMSDSYSPTLRTFRRYGTFTGGYMDFIEARSQIRGVILKDIEPKISRELSDEIIGQLCSNMLSDSNRRIIDDLRTALAGFYSGDRLLGEISVCRVREILDQSPDDFPPFKNSVLFRKIAEAKAQPVSDNRSIHVMI